MASRTVAGGGEAIARWASAAGSAGAPDASAVRTASCTPATRAVNPLASDSPSSPPRRADRSCSRWRSSLAAMTRTIAISASVAEGLARQVQEHGLEVGLDDVDPSEGGTGRARRREDAGEGLAGVADGEIDGAVGRCGLLDAVNGRKGVGEGTQVAVGREAHPVAAAHQGDELGPRALGDQLPLVED